MDVINVSLKLLSGLVRVFTEYGESSLVLSCGMHLEIDVILFEQSMKVGELRDHANRAEDGKGRSDDLITHTSHHVTAAGGDFVYRNRQRNPRVLEAHELAGCQAVAMNHSTTTL